MTDRLSVAIIGAGRVARDHVYAVQSNPQLQLVAIADPDATRRERFARHYGCGAYAEHRALLDQEEIDLVLAGVPHALHAPIVLDALHAGTHVLVEKPMAMTVAECDSLMDIAERQGVRLMVGHTQHFFQANLVTKALIERGAIGDLVLATQAWYKPFGLADRPAWMLDRATGGGMWWMNGAHMLDILLWLTGSEVVAVKGSVTNRIMRQNAPDSIIAMLAFANGVHATLAHSGFKRPPDHGPAEQWLTTEFTGTEGMIKTVSYEGQVWLQTEGAYEPVAADRDEAEVQEISRFVHQHQGDGMPDALVARSVVEEIAGVKEEVAAFVEAIQTGAELPVRNTHARAVVATLLAVEESSRTGQEIWLQ